MPLQSFTFILKGNVDQDFTVEADSLGEAWVKVVTEFSEKLGKKECHTLTYKGAPAWGSERGAQTPSCESETPKSKIR
jgi:hypothetical protein